MDKPPTKAKPSAEAEEAPDELRARLLELAQDSFAAFYREPTEENLQLAQLLLAISSMPERRRELAQYERWLAGEAAPQTNPKHPDKFWRKVWVRLIPPLVADCGGDPDTVARELVSLMPAPLRAKCPKYPTTQDEIEAAAQRVAKSIEPELALWRHSGPWNPLKVGRAVLRGVGMTKQDAKSLLRADQWASKRSSQNPPSEGAQE
jgi:hypothetical protein